jgi:hypothetical protein
MTVLHPVQIMYACDRHLVSSAVPHYVLAVYCCIVLVIVWRWLWESSQAGDLGGFHFTSCARALPLVKGFDRVQNKSGAKH